MLSTEEQIRHMQSKGIRFERITVSEAAAYLEQNNNYYKICAYRKNFPKHPGGEFIGNYIDLDFAELKDLAIIDMRMRYTFIHLALDIEHFAKVHLLRTIEKSDNDGYQIVAAYYKELKNDDVQNLTNRFDHLCREIERNRNNSYCGGIISKYDGNYPVWAFVEIIPFGSLISFYQFCARTLNDKQLNNEYYLLLSIKELRNAAAHSNCLIHELGVGNTCHKPNYEMLRKLAAISKVTRDNHLKNERMRQIVTLLYLHFVLVSSQGVRDRAKTQLNGLIQRMYRNINQYDGNEKILTNFNFLKKVIDILFD